MIRFLVRKCTRCGNTVHIQVDRKRSGDIILDYGDNADRYWTMRGTSNKLVNCIYKYKAEDVNGQFDRINTHCLQALMISKFQEIR